MSMHPNRNLFKEFPNRVFVETGTYRGDGIQLALDAGFEKIVSVDIDYNNVRFCWDRFDLSHSTDKDILIYNGNSGTFLSAMIEKINEPITFWLDSHWQMFDNEPKGQYPWPLLAELAQIRNHHVKNHTIIIDDMLILTHPGVTGWTKDMIENHLLWINPAYKFEYFSNPVIDSILVAHV